MVYVPVLIEVCCRGTIMRKWVRAGWIFAEIVDSKAKLNNREHRRLSGCRSATDEKLRSR